MLVETDETFINFGFEIKDLGCCKVVAHKEWSTHAHVGILFTLAAPAKLQAAIQAVTSRSK